MLMPPLQLEPPVYELTAGWKEAAATCAPTTVEAVEQPDGQPVLSVRTPMVT
jgi:hypothetical protein